MHKKILVLGANGKIGNIISEYLINCGHYVLLQDLGFSQPNNILDTEDNSNFKYLIGDISNTEYLENVVFKDDFDVVINTSYLRGKDYGEKFNKLTMDQFNDTISLSLGSSFALMQMAFNKSISEKKELNFINFSSIYGVIAPRFEIYEGTEMTMPIEYAAVKSALLGLTRYFAKAAKGTLFRVNCVSPGGIYDNQDEQFKTKYNEHCRSKGMLQPSDLNGLINFLVSDGSRYINGQNIIVDDGFTL